MLTQEITFIMLYVSYPPAGLFYGNSTLTFQFSILNSNAPGLNFLIFNII
jgi:hypothetical protein